MSNKIEYLVKYSVAPPPSRDYYGLKVFQDEVILYLWRISHGPHKAPIVYRAKLIQFSEAKFLQDEIRRGFGKYLLKYVNNIAEENRNLLTLPKSIIGNISRYLKYTDIIKLSSLSHIAYEVFNTDLVWQILYTRDKKANLSLGERKEIVYDWKQLYKAKQMQTSIKEQKKFKTSNLSVINNSKTNKLLMKPTNNAPKAVSNKPSTINIMTKKHSESLMKDLVTIPLSKPMSDTRFRTCTKNEKPLLQKKSIKNTNSIFDMNEKNVKKDIIMPKTTTGKQETGRVSKRNEIFDKQINRTVKSEKYSNKINNIHMKSTTSTQESKLKSKTQTASKTSISNNIMGNIKSSPVLTQNSHSKSQSKINRKPKKKVTATKSEILSTDQALSEKPFIVGDDRIDLADLIETTLTNIRSPRSIFDYDFSCVQKSKRTRDVLDIKNEIQNFDKFKELRSTGSNVITNNFSKIIRDKGILEKLSEKSEPFSEASNESLVNDKKPLSTGDNNSFPLCEKYIKAREELRKSLDWKRNDSVSSQHRWDPYSDINFQNKSFISPRKIDNNNELFPISKKPLRATFLKTYTSNGLESRKEKSYKDV